MFNADGGEAEMCGNGIRCVAKYAHDHGLSAANPMRVQTGRGVLTLDLAVVGGRVDRVTVNMGEPILTLADVPVDAAAVSRTGREHEYRLDLGDDGAARRHVRLGRQPARGRVRPQRQAGRPDPRRPAGRAPPGVPPAGQRPLRPGDLAAARSSMRTWERGSGVTLACGTGACAVAVAGVLTGRTGRQVLAHLPGGDLSLEWRAVDDAFT